MTRSVIDAPTLLHPVAEGVPVADGHRRVAPSSCAQLTRHLDSTADAEYLAVTRLQADLFVSVDPEARARGDGIVPVRRVDQLSG